MMKPVGTGIIGMGKVAEEIHCPQMAQSEQFHLVAVCDRTPERLKIAEEKFGAKGYTDIDEFLANDEIEFVIIATPPNSHCEYAIKCLQAGKNVMVEKPFAMNSTEALKMIHTASGHHLLITCHQNRRFDGDFLTVGKIIRDGILGNVYSIESHWMHFGESWTSWGVKEFNPTWRIQRQFGGGMVYDYAGHLVDQIWQLNPVDIESVYADLQSRIWSEEVDDHFKCFIRFTNHTTAFMEATNNARIPLPRWYVIGDKGTLLMEWYGLGTQKIRVVTDTGEQLFDLLPDARELLFKNVYEGIREGKELMVKPGEILKTIRLIDAIFKSSLGGHEVKF